MLSLLEACITGPWCHTNSPHQHGHRYTPRVLGCSSVSNYSRTYEHVNLDREVHPHHYSTLLLFCFCHAGDVRPFIRNIFKTHELVDKARNGDRGVGSPLHYPALTPAVNNQGAAVAAATEAGSARENEPAQAAAEE